MNNQSHLVQCSWRRQARGDGDVAGGSDINVGFRTIGGGTRLKVTRG